MLSSKVDRAMASLQNAEQAVVGALGREEQAVKQDKTHAEFRRRPCYGWFAEC